MKARTQRRIEGTQNSLHLYSHMALLNRIDETLGTLRAAEEREREGQKEKERDEEREKVGERDSMSLGRGDVCESVREAETAAKEIGDQLSALCGNDDMVSSHVDTCLRESLCVCVTMCVCVCQ